MHASISGTIDFKEKDDESVHPARLRDWWRSTRASRCTNYL
jgi:hypothetical protein